MIECSREEKILLKLGVTWRSRLSSKKKGSDPIYLKIEVSTRPSRHHSSLTHLRAAEARPRREAPANRETNPRS